MKTKVMYLFGAFATLALAVCVFYGVDPLAAGSMGLAMAGAAAPEMLKKLTLKNCGIAPDAEMVAKLQKMYEKDKKSARIDVLDIFGIAKKAKPGSTAFGDYLRFAGQFKATNLLTKEQFTAGAVILPRFLEEQLFAVMSVDAVNDVQFAFRISVEYDADTRNARHYQYKAQPLLKPAENDALSLLEAQVKQNVLALPAPDKK